MAAEFLLFRDHKGNDPLVQDMVVRVDELNEHLVWSSRKTVHDERLPARVRPVPGCIVHSCVDVPDSLRHFESGRAENRRDAKVLGAGT